MTGIVIVGAGECGTRAALSAREAGFEGAITLFGQEGGMPYERPPLSKSDAGAVVRRAICTEDTLDKAGIEYRQNIAVTAISPETSRLSLSDGSDASYTRLLLATGASPRLLDCIGSEHAQVLRSYEDARAIFSKAVTGKSAVIIGAGLIGLELAASLRKLGMSACVLELGPRALGRAVPEILANRLVLRHRAEGVNFRFNCQIDAIASDHILLAGGECLPADLIIAAIGVTPETELARQAGLDCNNGICVDDQLRSSAPDIFAAGDCAALRRPDGTIQRFETWRNARDQGDLAGRNLAGAEARFSALPWFWSDQYDLGLQVVGDVSGAPSARRTISPDNDILFWLDADGRLIGAAGLGTGRSAAKDIALAERLIEAGVSSSSEVLSDCTHNLKFLLKCAKAA
ncbi:NAD(P)/FAD-dependent oxidoreductase [Roseinatronobacter alkalisoli]|uniref:FAD-dependent oxidoreductase n=1 Tax=Roseinatronobacter alkalisoli TaxID=3028235 RepID=A0ABT5TEJ1_9RHOB|nr:FAD-dependent oxidoreductase [Roseinatronobacter sp. HJB301]MDD7973537.1 FAD-dependent oxidoreductase [Roseinatronobacter sp. HJB301]